MANGHKETSLQQVTLACGDKPNGICLSPPLHSADSPHLLPLLVQAQLRSLQPTHATKMGGLCSMPCRGDLQAAPKGLESHRASAPASQLARRTAPLLLTAQDQTHVCLASGGPLSNWVLGRSLQNGPLFSQSVCVKHPFTGKRRRVQILLFHTDLP